MSRFNVGDRVECIKDTGVWKMGEQATVERVMCDGECITLTVSGVNRIRGENWRKIKEYEEPNFKNMYVLIEKRDIPATRCDLFHTIKEVEERIKALRSVPLGFCNPLVYKIVSTKKIMDEEE